MKKMVSVFLIILLLCSCSENEIVPKLKGVSFTARLTYYNEVYSFDGEILSDNALKVSIKEPEELEGLNLTVNRDGTTAEYKGLTYSAVEGTMPFSKIIESVYEPLSIIADSEGLLADTNGKISGKAGGIEYNLTLSPTGLPQKLELPDERFSVSFYNVTIKEDVNE